MVKFFKYLLLLRKLTKRYNKIILEIRPHLIGDFSFLGSKIFKKYSLELHNTEKAITKLKKLRIVWKKRKTN